MNPRSVAILGAGSWGTAVAIHLAAVGNRVLLWGHDPVHIEQLIQVRSNEKYLPGVPFPPSLMPMSSLHDVLLEEPLVIVAVPSHAFSSVLAGLPKLKHGLAWLTKGLDPDSNQFLSMLVAAKFGKDYPLAIISGPSFAREVAKQLPTALSIAGNSNVFSGQLRTIFHHGHLRAYLTDDFIGVQLCGAVKNVLAIACGVSDGLNYGANAKAAIITRGLAELRRLGAALHTRAETFMGLAGVGDLVLTCTDDQSRNRRFGLQLGRGVSLLDAESGIGQVVEGKYNAAQVCALAKQYQVDMPICEVIFALLSEKIRPEEAVRTLMQRPATDE